MEGIQSSRPHPVRLEAGARGPGQPAVSCSPPFLPPPAPDQFTADGVRAGDELSDATLFRVVAALPFALPAFASESEISARQANGPRPPTREDGAASFQDLYAGNGPGNDELAPLG